MKRTKITLAEIAARDNLLEAVWKAARGKRHRPDVIRFTDSLDKHIDALAEDILQANVPFGYYREFYIHDPKKRRIHAACFEDRVLHHAIMNLAEPVFERGLVPTTYACRPGKGVHCAIKQVQHNLRRYPWFVKSDIAGYFPAIDHRILFRLLERRFKGQEFLYLLWRIIDSWHDQPDRGLPIGSLTSQHFANYYLNGADRFLLEQVKVSGYVRYMDDQVFWCEDKESAKAKLAELKDYLRTERRLRLKPQIQVNRSQRGISFCGYRVFPGTVLLNRRKRKRYQQLRLYWEYQWLLGNITEQELQHIYQSVHAITLHADSTEWRRKNLRLHPSVYI